MYAIIKTLEMIPNEKNVKIFTDSEYCMKGIKKNTNK